MSETQEIEIMKCWLFRNAALRWHRSPGEVADLFKNYHLYEFISDSYELLHVSGYDCALDDLESILSANGVDVYAQA